MKQEDKELLLKDLCARLPYGVIVNVNGNNEKVDEINPFEEIMTCGFQSFDVNECKPYLRPMTSMVEEERKYFQKFAFPYDFVDALNKHHFDYRGLIEHGLAIAITRENNPYK